MNFPEYLSLFSNKGIVDIQVVFEDHAGSVSSRKMSPKEISFLITQDGKGFHKTMTFDDWPFMITKYEIEPAENKLTVFAKKNP